MNYIRKNNISIDKFNFYKENIDLLIMNNDNLINEILSLIYISNPKLYKILLKNKIKKKKKVLWKYIIRSIFRATPLAFFSTVIFLQSFNKKKYFDIDSLWMHKFLEKYIIQDKNENTNCYYFKNGNVFEFKEYYEILGKNPQLLKKNNSLDMILKILEKPKNFFEIKNELIKLNIIINDENLKHIIKILKYNKIIVSNYRTNLNNSSNINIMKKILKLSNLDLELKEKLNDITERLDGLGESYSVESVEYIINLMEKIINSEYYINTISYGNNFIEIQNSYKKIINKFDEEFSKLLNYIPNSNFQNNIIGIILEKYSKNNLVPLNKIYFETKNFVLFDEEKKGIFFDIIKEIFIDLYNLSDKDYCDLKEFDFIDKCIKKLEKNNLYKKRFTINDMDYIFEGILYNNQLNFIGLSNEIGSKNSGRLAGRFILNDNFSDDYKINFIEDLKMKYEENNILPVIIIEKNEDYRIYNIISKYNYNIHKIYLDTFCDFENKYSIKLDDLFMYVNDYEELCLYSKKENKRLNILQLDALNKKICSNIFQYLFSVTENMTVLDILEFLKKIAVDKFLKKPIYYGEILLFQPSFILKSDFYKFYKNKNDFINALKIKLEKNIMLEKNLIKIIKDDQYFILDISIDIHQEILIDELNKNGYLILQKVNDIIQNSINKNLKSYNLEYIFSKTSVVQKNDLNIVLDYYGNLELKTLEDDVISMKIYIRYSFQNIILFDIYKMIIKFRELYFDLKFSYIKYRELKDHLRIRFYIKKEYKYEVLEKIVNSINRFLYIDFFEIVPFYQEKIKYNIDSYELYKEYIKFESELIVNILEKYSGEKRYILYFMLLRTIKIFDMQNEYEYIVSNLLRLKDIRKKTNRDKKEIILKIKKLKDSILKGRELEKLYIEWDQSLINYVYSLKDIPYSTKYDILKNLMHIQINRFYGVDRNLEEEILEVVFILLKFVINNKCDEKSDKDEHII